MKKQFFLLIIISAILVGSSCNKELQRVNKNPNNLESPDATTLLSNILVTEFYNNTDIAWTVGNGYSQYMTFSQDYYNTTTRYSPVTNEPYWDPMFEAARDANILYTQAQQQQNPVMEAAALTLRSYAFAQLTELWGDIPFTQALQGASGKYTPAYDSQQTVYTDSQEGILASLQRADSLLKSAPAANLSGDLLYNGNVASWRRFINALRLRYLIRVSGKMAVSSQIQSIVSEDMLMQDASQSAAIALPTTTPYNFPSLTERSGDFNVKFLNSTLYDVFKNTGDAARLQAYFAPNSNNADQSSFSFSHYGGMPLVVDASSDQANTSSHFNVSFTSGSNSALIKSRIMTYAEQEFILAEAALKGYITGSAKTYYQNGVKGAYAEVGLSAAQATTYLSNSNVQLDIANKATALSQIITQKWLVNINNGFEGWLEYKRTGYPALQSGGSVNLNNNKIPERFLYPDAEKTINSANYSTEIQKMGGDETTNYTAWW